MDFLTAVLVMMYGKPETISRAEARELEMAVEPGRLAPLIITGIGGPVREKDLEMMVRSETFNGEKGDAANDF